MGRNNTSYFRVWNRINRLGWSGADALTKPVRPRNELLQQHPKLYRIYYNILSRCNNRNNARYPRYGGRGITCTWKSFSDFVLDMSDSYYEHVALHGVSNTSIERINNDGVIR